MVFKLGRKSGYTVGRVNGIKTLILRRRDEHSPGKPTETVTEDYTIVSEKDEATFSETGDSGAFILDGEGRLVGLLFAGGTGESNERMSRFIGVEELFEDIKKQTDAVDVKVFGSSWIEKMGERELKAKA
jgi:hypothetical protein